jgi:hypothetical protein
MQVNILHDGALTVELESNGTVTSKVGGRLPTLDDIARQRALSTYFTDIDRPSPTWYDQREEL